MARTYGRPRIPNGPREMADVLADPQLAAEAFGEDGRGAEEFKRRYIDNLTRNGDLDRQIEAAAQARMVELSRETRSGGFPLAQQAPTMPGRGALHCKWAPGARVDGVLKAEPGDELGEFMRATWYRNASDTRYARVRAALDIRNAMSERVPSSGGFLVPENLRANILAMVLERSIVRPRARVIPMDSLRVPYPTLDETSHVSSVYGGVTGFWTEEGAAITPSQPAFGRVVLEAKKLAIYTEIPNELLNDSPVLTQWMTDTIPQALAWYEDNAFINGTGVGQPQGIINAPGAVVPARATSSKVQYVDIVTMFSRLLPQSLRSPSTVWLCSPDVLPQLLQMAVTDPKLTTQSVSPPVWLGGSWAAGDRPSSILGIPLVVSEKMPALGSQGDIALVDWSFFLLGDRMQIQATSSEHYRFANDLTAYRWLERCDGRAWLQSPLTLENGSANTVSPYVLLHS